MQATVAENKWGITATDMFLVFTLICLNLAALRYFSYFSLLFKFFFFLRFDPLNLHCTYAALIECLKKLGRFTFRQRHKMTLRHMICYSSRSVKTTDAKPVFLFNLF